MPPLLCPDADTCYLYLLRHGATENNLARPPRLQGAGMNPGLSDEGHRQAQAAAELLTNRAIAAVYSSPMQRARETAGPIAVAQGVAVTVVAGLIEADVGTWEGREWGEIERTEPEAYRRFMDDPATNAYVGGESFGNVAARVIPEFEALLDRHSGESIVVVGHNVVNRAYLAMLSSVPMRRAREIIQSNCGVNIIRRRHGHDQLLTANAVFHLV